ncbi:hypothetical protein [Tropicibacter alexandrii]|uniref:hypothetical protein n=1 Tax=Tropicibacter alexandrii TaxID=2267683 RepID=UPI000EF4CBEC|nr:hypothetical protein [Tropicibacter alexandrii]
MSSSSSEAVATDTTNVAMDERTVVEEGNAIVESLIVSNDAAVISSALQPIIAAWQGMVSANNLNLVELTNMGGSLIEMIDKSQVKISDTAANMLRESMDGFESLLSQNKLNVELVDGISNRSFDMGERALDLVASVKTGDFADLSKSVMVFALVALAISAWVVKEN